MFSLLINENERGVFIEREKKFLPFGFRRTLDPCDRNAIEPEDDESIHFDSDGECVERGKDGVILQYLDIMPTHIFRFVLGKFSSLFFLVSIVLKQLCTAPTTSPYVITESTKGFTSLQKLFFSARIKFPKLFSESQSYGPIHFLFLYAVRMIDNKELVGSLGSTSENGRSSTRKKLIICRQQIRQKTCCSSLHSGW
jgi:hypothetical protein